MECPYCERRCKLSDGQFGSCQSYKVVNGNVVERFPHRYSSFGVTHIESIPFYHFQPGSRTFNLGGAGCDLDCHYCSNAYVARSDPEPLLIHELKPHHLVTKARQSGCHNIAFGINEPTVAFPSLVELAGVAKAAGMPTGVLTNGYMQPEIAEAMGDAFAFVNVSIKAMRDDFYRSYVGVPSVEPVLRAVEILHRKTHVEVSTPIVTGQNDGDIPAIASFIASVDKNIPWHVFRLLPEYKMSGVARPGVDQLNEALTAARQKLPYVYFGNFVGSLWMNTLCPTCGTVVVERTNIAGCVAKPRAYQLADGKCTACGAAVAIAGDPVEWNSADTEELKVKGRQA